MTVYRLSDGSVISDENLEEVPDDDMGRDSKDCEVFVKDENCRKVTAKDYETKYV